MLEYNQYAEEFDKAIQVGGCVCFECENCHERIFWYEGNIKYYYNKHYLKGCQLCKKGTFVMYGYKGPDSEL